MNIFNLAAKISCDTSEFDAGVKNVENSGKGLSDSMSGMFGKIETAAKAFLGAAVIAKVVDTIKSLATETAAAGDKIDKQSQVLGMSRKAYQEWDYILGQNGASIDSMSGAMKTLNNLILSGAEGTDSAIDAFAELGIHMEELTQLSQEQQFETVVKALQKMPAGAQKSALAVKLLGKQGMQLMPLLNQDAASIDELKKRAEELGLIMSDDAVDASVAYGDSLDDLQRTFNGFKYSIGAKILPFLTKGIQGITNYAGKLRKAYDEKGLAGVWDTLVESFRNIKWPTWEEVKGALEGAWNAVKEGAKSVLKLVFGETPDGGIAFPTPEELEQKVRAGLTAAWEGVKNLAKSVLRLLFGDGEDGGVDFPDASETWEKIKSVLTTWWGYIKGYAKGILKFIFGEDADGGVKWPTAAETWEKVKEIVSAWWEGIKTLAKGILNLALDTLGLPDIDKIVAKIKKWWADIKKKVKLTLQVNLFGFDPSKGETWEGNIMNDPRFPKADLSGIDFDDEHAKGLWDVPYDGYRAKLHRNEMVLTASRARDYRDGKSGNMDISSMASTIAGAVKEAVESATLRTYLNGKDITAEVSREQMRSVKARRFAT